MEQMNLETAVRILIDAANLAQSKGAFTLKDASFIQSSIEFFIPQDIPQQNVGDVKVEEN